MSEGNKDYYVFKMPARHEHRFEIDILNGPTSQDGGEVVAGPFGTMNPDDRYNDNGWQAANMWLHLNDRLHPQFMLNNHKIYDLVEDVAEIVSYFDDMGTSWFRIVICKWPEKLPKEYVVNPNRGFAQTLFEKYGMSHYQSGIPGRAFADYPNITVDKNCQLIMLSHMGGLDI